MPPEARSRSQHWHKEKIPAVAIDMLLIMMLSCLTLFRLFDTCRFVQLLVLLGYTNGVSN